jgi:hypothetical protein
MSTLAVIAYPDQGTAAEVHRGNVHATMRIPLILLVFLETYEPFMERQNRRQEADVGESLGEVAQ